MKSVVCRAAYLMASLVAAAGLAASTASADPPKTIEPGKLNIAMNGDMPMTQLKDGVLSGTDGSLMTMIAKQLGLQPVVHQMDWAAEIESTKQGKVDIMHGAMGWKTDRTKIMILTEPIYYFGTLLAQKDDHNWHSFADMKGHSVGALILFTSLFSFVTLPIVLIIDPGAFTATNWIKMVVLGANGGLTVLALIFYFHALASDEASFVAPFFQLIPVFGFVLGYLILGETLKTNQLLGGLLVVLGGLLLSLRLFLGRVKIRLRLLLLPTAHRNQLRNRA